MNLRNENADTIYIDIKKDGTLTFHNVPIVSNSNSPTFSIEKFQSGSGTYTIAPQGSTSNKDFYGLYIDCGDLPEPIDTPRLRKNGDTFLLSFEYFNGDFFQRMVFLRQK